VSEAKAGAFKAKGLALREFNAGEADRTVTLLLKGRGKVVVSAKGARKVKSKFLTAARPFCYADYTVYDGGRFRTLASADVIDNFYGITEDYDKLCAGAYFLELAEKTVMEELPCDDILHLLLVSLKAVEKNAHDPGLIRSVFDIKFLQLNGYAPGLDNCAGCGTDKALTHMGAFGAVCTRCAKEAPSVRISVACMDAVAYILSCEMRNLYLFNIDVKTAAELRDLGRLLLNAHSEVRTKSAGLMQ